MCQQTKNPVYWVGQITVCNLCNGPFHNDVMYDKNLGGIWGNICCWCFFHSDQKLGIGLGQKYQMVSAHKWLLVKGNE